MAFIPAGSNCAALVFRGNKGIPEPVKPQRGKSAEYHRPLFNYNFSGICDALSS